LEWRVGGRRSSTATTAIPIGARALPPAARRTTFVRGLHERARPPSSHAMGDRAEPSVLIVEDDHDIREALQGVLSLEGYRTVAAENGRDALDLLEHMQTPPFLLLVDLMMPVMNGWDFVAAVRRDPQLSEIPIVVVSAIGASQPVPEDVVFLKKPVQVERLLEVVREHRSHASA
jgi:CheY-like chemotaxis protein